MNRTVSVCLCLALLVVGVYCMVPKHKFLVFDDEDYVYGNTHVITGLSFKNLVYAVGVNPDHYWLPVTTISHQTDSHFFGKRAGLHHAMNVFFHIACVICLFLALLSLTGGFWQSAFVAALFALHPLNVDTVAWISQRKNLLSTLFSMFGLLFWARYARGPSVARYVPVFFCFALGLMSKPAIVAFPFVLLLLDFWPLQRWKGQAGSDLSLNAETGKRVAGLVLEKLPLFCLVGLSIFISTLSTSVQRGVTDPASFGLKTANALTAVIGYVRFILWPSGLCVFYPYPEYIPFWQATGALFLIFSVCLAVVLVWRKRPYLLTGWFWFLGTLVPVLGFMQVGLWPKMADRWMYIPGIGLFIMAAWGLPDLLGGVRRKKEILVLGAGFSLLSLSLVSFFQVAHWKDDESLFSRAAQVTTNNFVAYNNLGNAFNKKGQKDKALELFKKAIEVYPKGALSYRNIGEIHLQQEEYDTALGWFKESLKYYPDDPLALMKLAKCLDHLGRLEEARQYLTQLLTLTPNDYLALNNLANALGKAGDHKKAIACYRQSLKLNPDYALARANLGQVLLEEGRDPEAIRQFEQALVIDPSNALAKRGLKEARGMKTVDNAIMRAQLVLINDPDNPSLLIALGNLYMKRRDASQAISQYNIALEIDPGNASALTNLGLVYARKRRYKTAETYLQRAVSVAPESKAAHYNMACLMSMRRKPEEAIKWLEKAVERGLDDPHRMSKDRYLDNIRGLPEFEALVEKMSDPVKG